MKTLLFIVSCLLLQALPLHSDSPVSEQRVSDALKKLGWAVRHAENVFTPNSQEELEQLHKLSDRTMYLELRWSLSRRSRDRGTAPPRYVASLLSDADQLMQLSSDQSHQVLAAKIHDVADDLDLKAKNCTTQGWSKLVTVQICTRRSTRIVNGKQVWFVAKGWADDNGRWKPFPTFSSPITYQLAPGVYMVRVAGQTAVPMPVGGTGSDRQVVDLEVK